MDINRHDASGTNGAINAQKTAWKQTIEEMANLASSLEADGWDVCEIPAGHTSAETRTQGDSDRFGLVYVIPGNKVEPFEKAFVEGGFPQYRVFKRDLTGRTYLLTQLLEPSNGRAILLAGNVSMYDLATLVDVAVEEDEMYTHVQTLDTTHMGSFRHDSYEHFFPNPERYSQHRR
ncbi:DUF7529 family protein [Natrononativus amylolyticus]|uniref:DUF7529 family protein n=1 Tax=Natrononativus amylolyticus TaxID=2963434 RepID=UPI0020CC9424|nr:hypothetical protein [Natrononativus amylolyticus]